MFFRNTDNSELFGFTLNMIEIPYAIVTGATGGVGKAIVRKLTREGVNCIAIGSSTDSITKKLRFGDDLLFTGAHHRNRAVALDLARWDGEFNHSAATIEGYIAEGNISTSNKELVLSNALAFDNNDSNRYTLRVLVNCAGITQASVGIRMSPNVISNMINVNFASAVYLSNYAARLQMKQKSRKRLDIINVSSILGGFGDKRNFMIQGTSIYSATKAALSQFTRVYGKEVERLSINCHDIAPGLIPETDMIKNLPERAQENLLRTINGEITTVDEVSEQVLRIYKES